MGDERRAPGTVYLVGAGPGDPDLLTVRAAALLATADTVVHDRLIPPLGLLTMRTDVRLLDYTASAAVVRVVFRYPTYEYHDQLVLLKVQGRWTIADKFFTKIEL